MLSGIASLGIVTASFGSWLLGKVRSSKKRVRALRDATCSKLTGGGGAAVTIAGNAPTSTSAVDPSGPGWRM